MKSEELAAVKAFCHIDHDDDDKLVASLYAAAIEYMDRAGVPTPAKKSELYTLCIHSLVNEWYDGQSFAGNCTVGLRQLINQLKNIELGKPGSAW